MNAQSYKARISWNGVAGSGIQAIAIGVMLVAAFLAGCSDRRAGKDAGQGSQKAFATPAEAGEALKAAARANDESALQQILGPSAKSLFDTADPAANKADRQLFVSKYDQMNRWVLMSDGSEVLHIGADNFPFPVPVERSSEKWYFNSAAGEKEILARRIGENELLAIDACVAIDDAQQLYARKPRDNGAVPQYASRIISSPGKRDGLYWQAEDGHKPSPLGRVESFAPDVIATATAGGPLVIDGYTYRILTAQGASADGGAKSYLVSGKLTGGFALLATPVKYGETGIKTFLLGPEGFYERDLGNATADYAATTQEFNPTQEWASVE